MKRHSLKWLIIFTLVITIAGITTLVVNGSQTDPKTDSASSVTASILDPGR